MFSGGIKRQHQAVMGKRIVKIDGFWYYTGDLWKIYEILYEQRSATLIKVTLPMGGGVLS